MATFTPQMQEDPEGRGYGHYEGRSEKPQPDESGKSRGAALKLGEGIAQEGVEGVKSYLHDSIYKQAEPIRERYLNQLQEEYKDLSSGEARLIGPLGGKGPTVAVPGNQPKLMDMPIDAMGHTQPESRPEELKEVPRSLEAITGARKSGKISPTFYYMELDKLAQSTRARFPGFVDYIDEQFNKFTGREVANKAIASLTADINSFAETKSSGQAKSLAVLEKPEVIMNIPQQRYQELLSLAQQGADVSYAAMSMAAPGIAADQQSLIRSRELENKLKEGQLNEQAYKQARELARQHISLDTMSDVTNGMNAIIAKHMDMDHFKPGDIDSNNPQVAQESVKMASELAQFKVAALNRLNQRLLQGHGAELDPDDAVKIHNELDKLIDPAIHTLAGGDFKLAASLDMAIQADESSRSWKMGKDHPVLLDYQASLKYAPVGSQLRQRLDNDLVNAMASGKADYGSYLNYMTHAAQGKPLAEALGQEKAMGPESRRHAVEFITNLLHDKMVPPDVQMNMFHSILAPGFFKGITHDYTDLVTDEKIKGSDTLWGEVFTNPKIRARAKDLGILNEFDDAMTRTMTQEQWQTRFETLRNLQSQPWLSINYDTATGQWGRTLAPEVANSPYNMWQFKNYIAQIDDAIKTINMGMSGLKLQASEGTDPELAAIEAYASLGLDLTGAHELGGGPPSIPQQFLDVLVNARGQAAAEAAAQQQTEAGGRMKKAAGQVTEGLEKAPAP